MEVNSSTTDAVVRDAVNRLVPGQAAEAFNRLNDVEVVPADEVGFAGMNTEMFMKLLVTELQNQDPLEPVGNEQLVNQLSAMQSLQSNVELRQSVERMSQAFTTTPSIEQLSSAASFIGQSVTGADSLTGIVDRASLQGGTAFVGMGQVEIPLDRIASVNTAESLVGRLVTGTTSANEKVIGIVEAAVENGDEDFVTVDGKNVPLKRITSVNTAESLLNKLVTVRADGKEFQGVVEQVVHTVTGPRLSVGGEGFRIADIVNLIVGKTTLP